MYLKWGQNSLFLNASDQSSASHFLDVLSCVLKSMSGGQLLMNQLPTLLCPCTPYIV